MGMVHLIFIAVMTYPLSVAKMICSINDSLKSDDSEATLNELKSHDLALRSITDECCQTYHEKLAAARNEKSAGALTIAPPGMTFVSFLRRGCGRVGGASHPRRLHVLLRPCNVELLLDFSRGVGRAIM